LNLAVTEVTKRVSHTLSLRSQVHYQFSKCGHAGARSQLFPAEQQLPSRIHEIPVRIGTERGLKHIRV